MSRYLKKISNRQAEAYIQSLSHDGRGVAQVNNKVTFITNALPGEKVLFYYKRRHGHFDEGEMLKILEFSESREQQTCPFYHFCGGCTLQHLKHPKQIQHKLKVVLEQLKHFGHQVVPLTILPPIIGLTQHYRSKARFSVRFIEKKKGVLVGFHEKNGRYIADIQHCSILHPKLSNKISLLRDLIMSLDHYAIIPQVEVAAGDQEIAFIFRNLETLTAPDLNKIILFGQKNFAHIYLQPGGLDSVYKVYPDDGEDYLRYTLPLEQIELLFHPSDFTQINYDINSKMVSAVIQLLEPTKEDHILDLFCGLGNFTIPLAKYSAWVTGVEGNERMVERAKNNANHNGMQNVDFYTADLTQDILCHHWVQHLFTKILLDPPRSGAKELIDQMKLLLPQRIVYVSCNPATLARDADILVHRHQYQLQKIGILDMFPHTSHVESVALFCR